MKCKLFPLNKQKKYIFKQKNITTSLILIILMLLLIEMKNYFIFSKDYIIFLSLFVKKIQM